MDDQEIVENQIADELAKLQKMSDEHLAGWQRAKADYLNLKRQAEKEKEDLAKFAQAGAVLQFLPIYDNLKRSTQHIPEEQMKEEWVKGVLHIHRQFEDTLKSMGITPIATVGSTFDPNLHHAVSKVKQDGIATDTIISEVKAGFMLGDRVLEPAQVTVAE